MNDNTQQETETPTPRREPATLRMAKTPADEWEHCMHFVNELDNELKYHEMTDEQLGAWVRKQNPMLRRTVFGYSVLVDNCCDPNVSHLAFKPEIANQAERITQLERENVALKQQLENERQFGLEMTLTIERKDAVISSLKQQLEKAREDTARALWLARKHSDCWTQEDYDLCKSLGAT